jgi:hypothetical protein
MTSDDRVVTTPAVHFRVSNTVVTTKYVKKGSKMSKIRMAVNPLRANVENMVSS